MGKVHFYVCKKNIVCGKLPLLGNGVREGEKGSAHAVGELVKQDPGIVRVQATTGDEDYLFALMVTFLYGS